MSRMQWNISKNQTHGSSAGDRLLPAHRLRTGRRDERHAICIRHQPRRRLWTPSPQCCRSTAVTTRRVVDRPGCRNTEASSTKAWGKSRFALTFDRAYWRPGRSPQLVALSWPPPPCSGVVSCVAASSALPEHPGLKSSNVCAAHRARWTEPLCEFARMLLRSRRPPSACSLIHRSSDSTP